MMKKVKLFNCFLLVFNVGFSVIMLSSCSTLYMANPCIDPIVFTKPIYNDTVKVSNFIGGKFNWSRFPNYEDKLKNTKFGQFYLFQTRTDEYFSASYGLFGYMGNAGVKNDFDITTYKQFYGGGLSADIQLTIPIADFVLRPIGFKGSCMYESGDYFRYKYNEEQYPGFFPDNYMVNLSQTIGGSFILAKDKSIGVDFSTGFSNSIPHMYMDITFSTIFSYSVPNYTFYIQKSVGLVFGNDDYVLGVNLRLH